MQIDGPRSDSHRLNAVHRHDLRVMLWGRMVPTIELYPVYALTVSVSLAELKGPFEGYDSTATEVYFLGKTVQPFLDNMGLNLQLRTRRDVDRLVEFMLTNFGL